MLAFIFWLGFCIFLIRTIWTFITSLSSETVRTGNGNYYILCFIIDSKYIVITYMLMERENKCRQTGKQLNRDEDRCKLDFLKFEIERSKKL